MILERPGYCSLIGADDQGWGWDLTRNRLFHGGGMVRVGSNVPIKNERENGNHAKPSDVCKRCAKKDKKTQHSAKQCHVDVYDEDDNNCFYPCPHEEYQIPARVVMILDCDNGWFGFMTDGHWLGVAFSTLKKEGPDGVKRLPGPLFPVVSCVWGNCEVTMRPLCSLSPRPKSLMNICRKSLWTKAGGPCNGFSATDLMLKIYYIYLKLFKTNTKFVY